MSKQTKYFDITTDKTYGFCLFVCLFVCRAKMFKLSMTALKKNRCLPIVPTFVYKSK